MTTGKSKPGVGTGQDGIKGRWSSINQTHKTQNNTNNSTTITTNTTKTQQKATTKLPQSTTTANTISDKQNNER